MVHNTKKKALYEVIGRTGLKSGYEQLHPNSTAGTNAGQTPSASAGQAQGVVRWTIKPSVVQFNAGRIEFSIPYQVGIAVVLGVLLAAVVLFRLGERVGSREVVVKAPAAAKLAESRPVSPKPVTQDTPAVKQPTAQDTSAAAVTATQPISTPPTGSVQGGRNRIVLKIYQVRSHLEPAKEYFDKMGIATEIIEKNNWYYLVTKNKYDNPEKAGTDGNLAKRKIIEIGSGYKAPAGFESFGPKPFSDAFGMRFDE
ncbi:MAG: hypothetical protein ABSA64_06940 [Sedimentisphaerales bacterium]|jgi:hypothetical protein